MPKALRPPSVHEVLEAAKWRASTMRAVTIEVHAGREAEHDAELLAFAQSVRRIRKLYRRESVRPSDAEPPSITAVAGALAGARRPSAICATAG